MEECTIQYTDFKKEFKKNLDSHENIFDYPTVYILKNDKYAYVGETTNIKQRVNAHINNKKRKNLKTISIISSKKFNQSATYNIETKLINYFIADGKYKLQNTSQTKSKSMHNYYQKNTLIKYYLKKIGMNF